MAIPALDMGSVAMESAHVIPPIVVMSVNIKVQYIFMQFTDNFVLYIAYTIYSCC